MPEEVEDPETPEVDEGTESFDEDRARAKIAKANSEAANLRKRLKDAEDKAAKFDELEESKKSDADKLTEANRALEDRAAKAESEAARLRVALSKGLSLTQAKRLVGATDEELEADADELVASFKTDGDDKGKGTPAGARPTEQLKGGSDPTTEPAPDIRKIVADIPRGL